MQWLTWRNVTILMVILSAIFLIWRFTSGESEDVWWNLGQLWGVYILIYAIARVGRRTIR